MSPGYAYSHVPPSSAPSQAEPLASKDVRVLLAVIDQYSREGRATIGGVVARTGRGRATVHDSLHYLRSAGFVDFEPRHDGTLRPLVREVGLS